jgi:hypothetical protein
MSTAALLLLPEIWNHDSEMGVGKIVKKSPANGVCLGVEIAFTKKCMGESGEKSSEIDEVWEWEWLKTLHSLHAMWTVGLEKFSAVFQNMWDRQRLENFGKRVEPMASLGVVIVSTKKYGRIWEKKFRNR